MGHGFGMNHDIGADLVTEYQDPCCILSQNNPFVKQPWMVNFGPALCLSHLVQKGWMYQRRLYVDDGGWMSGGISLPLASLEDPSARANLGIKLTFTRDQKAWDYFVEYVKPTDWNRGLVNAFVFIRRLAPYGLGQTPAHLGSIEYRQPWEPRRNFGAFRQREIYRGALQRGWQDSAGRSPQALSQRRGHPVAY